VSSRVYSLYIEAIEAVKVLVAFSASSTCRFGFEAELKQRLGFETAPSLCGLQFVPKCP
jgi:hypothetical protein